MRINVVGIGNPWATDDAVGLAVVQQLQAEYTSARLEQHLADDVVTFAALPQAGLSLLDFLAQGEVLILVDAARSHAPPGTLHCETWQPDRLLSRGVERASSHGLGVREALELAAVLRKLPERVILWGIEVASTEPGAGLSPAVAAALPLIVRQLRQALENGVFINSGGGVIHDI